MAVSARELFLVVRASDHASRVMRDVGRSIAGLGKVTDVAAAKQKFLAEQMMLANKATGQREKLGKLTENQSKATQKYSDMLGKAQLAEQDLANATARRAGIERKMQEASRRFSAMTPPQRALLGRAEAHKAEMAAFEKQLASVQVEEGRLAKSAQAAATALSEQEARVVALGEAMGATRAEILQTVAAQRELAAAQARVMPMMDREAARERSRARARTISAVGGGMMFGGGAL